MTRRPAADARPVPAAGEVAAAAEAARAHLSRRSLSRRATRTPIRRSAGKSSPRSPMRGTQSSTRATQAASARPISRSASRRSCQPRPHPRSAARVSRTARRPRPTSAPTTRSVPGPSSTTMIGGFFKFHWNDGQEISVKVDEPNHPLNAAFKGKPQMVVVDETYTFGRDTYSRKNLRVLTSVDYAKMSDEDKAKESNPRADGDYGLSWIARRQGSRLLRGLRPQREDLRQHRDPRARAGRHAVCPRRSAG